MTEFVYILSEHDEYGAENVFATRDREKIKAELARRRDEDLSGASAAWALKMSEYYAKCVLTFDTLEEREISERGEPLGDGWGGYQIHIVPLA